jgi:dienelactone hydrolase
MTHRFRYSIARLFPLQRANGTSLAITPETAMSYPWCAILLVFVAAHSCSMPAAPDFTVAGEKANALLCRPEGKGPFPSIVWSHGRVTDTATLERARTGGWRHICETLASDGFLAFVPIREHFGVGPQSIPYNQEELSRAIDYVKGLSDVDPSRMALMGHSRGGLLTLLVGLERKDLKALVITAPADIPPHFSQAVARVSHISIPILLLVEEGDEMGSLGAVNALDQALRSRGEEVRTIRYNRGGGHYLFIRVDYWWDDLRTFLRERLL